MAFLIPLVLSLLLIPLIPALSDFGYEETKVLSFLGLTFLAAIAWIKNGKKQIERISLIKILAAVLILVLGITSALSSDLKASFLGQPPYYQGWILYLFLFLFFWFISSVKISLERWAVILTIPALTVASLAFKDWIILKNGGEVPTYASRVVSTFGQPNFLAGFLLLIIPFSYWLTKSGDLKLKWLGVVGIIVEVGGIFLSGSRAAEGLLVVLVLGWLMSKLKGWLGWLLIGISITTILGSLLVSHLLLLGPVWEELDKPPQVDWFNHEVPERGFIFWQSRWSKDPEKRLYILPVVGDLVLKRPLLGYGLERMVEIFPTSGLSWRHGLDTLVVDRSHNYPLDLLFFSGIGGLLGWLGLLGVLFRKVQSKLLLISLILYFVWVQVQNQSVVQLIYFWFLAGLIDQEKDYRKKDKD